MSEVKKALPGAREVFVAAWAALVDDGEIVSPRLPHTAGRRTVARDLWAPKGTQAELVRPISTGDQERLGPRRRQSPKPPLMNLPPIRRPWLSWKPLRPAEKFDPPREMSENSFIQHPAQLLKFSFPSVSIGPKWSDLTGTGGCGRWALGSSAGEGWASDRRAKWNSLEQQERIDELPECTSGLFHEASSFLSAGSLLSGSLRDPLG